MRADKYILPILKEKLQTKEISREVVINYIKNGGVKINNIKITKPSHSLDGDEEVQFDFVLLNKLLFPFSNQNSRENKKSKLNIIYENLNFIVLNKKVGMVMHPGAGVYKGTLIQNVFPNKKYSENTSYRDLGVVHRLDKDTSGIVLVSKNRLLTSYLASLFEKRKISKYYLALSEISNLNNNYINVKNIDLCEDIIYKFSQIIKNFDPSPYNNSKFKNRVSEGLKEIEKNRYFINGFIFRKGRDSFRFVLEKRNTSFSIRAKSAMLELIPMYRSESKVIFLIKLVTGRTHQIRATLKELGFPIINDPIYGKNGLKDCERMFLHSFAMYLEIPAQYLIPAQKVVINEYGSFETVEDGGPTTDLHSVKIRAYFHPNR